MVEQHIAALGQYLDLAQPFEFRGRALSNDAAHGAIVAGLLINGRGAKLDQAAADQLTEDYLDALEDLPAWTVREALRKWNRAESQQLDPREPHDFKWRPAPAILRKLAYLELWPYKARILQLEKVRAAVPLIEFSDEHREMMLKRLSGVLHDAAGNLLNSRATAASAQPTDAYQEAGK